MINVQQVLEQIPHFETFCSVQKLHGLVEELRADCRFAIGVAGTSTNGVPIHHVRFGAGSVKVLIVAFPHCMEPIGGLTAFSLMSLLRRGSRTLCDADVEWHIVPCIDPDGALLNEGWTQGPFSLDSYMRNYYLQATSDQVDTSFPIVHKKLVWTKPSQEAQILKNLLDRIRPDFYFSLHNAWTGGAFYFITRDIDRRYHQELYRLLEHHNFPLQKRPIWRQFCTQFGQGILEPFSIRKYYDYVEQSTPYPEKVVQFGAHSRDYLMGIKPSALTFTAEMGYVRHPSDESDREIDGNLRHLKLKVDADTKFLATMLLQEWNKIKRSVDVTSPFYRAIVGGMVLPLDEEKIYEGGLPLSFYPTRDILFNPQYDKALTECDQFNACMVDGGFLSLRSYQLVRLLKESPQTAEVRQSIEKLERLFETALAAIERHVDFGAFQVVDCDTLAKVQLGSGLIVLNSILDSRARSRMTVNALSSMEQ